MAVTLNRRAYEHAKELINDGRFVFDERDVWSEHRPSAQEENDFIRLHDSAKYGKGYFQRRKACNPKDTRLSSKLRSRHVISGK